MRKPENFHKIDNADITIDSTDCRIDVSKDGFFVFENGANWKNVILFEMDWDNNLYKIKICEIGNGADGWYLDEKLAIPKELMKTLASFKEFVISNIKYIATKVDLTDRTHNKTGVTDLSSPEIKHTVASSSGPNVTYEVKENAGGIKDEWTCTCPAFQYSKATPQTCKHIIQLK